jgi:hypothetical protein
MRSLTIHQTSSGIFGFAFSRRRLSAICCAWRGRYPRRLRLRPNSL